MKLIHLSALNNQSLLTLHYAKLLGAEKAMKTFLHEMKDKAFCCVHKLSFCECEKRCF